MSGAMFLMLKKSSDRRQREALEAAFKVIRFFEFSRLKTQAWNFNVILNKFIGLILPKSFWCVVPECTSILEGKIRQMGSILYFAHSRRLHAKFEVVEVKNGQTKGR